MIRMCFPCSPFLFVLFFPVFSIFRESALAINNSQISLPNVVLRSYDTLLSQMVSIYVQQTLS